MEQLIRHLSSFVQNELHFTSGSSQSELKEILEGLKDEKRKQDDLIRYLAKEAPELFEPI